LRMRATVTETGRGHLDSTSEKIEEKNDAANVGGGVSGEKRVFE